MSEQTEEQRAESPDSEWSVAATERLFSRHGAVEFNSLSASFNLPNPNAVLSEIPAAQIIASLDSPGTSQLVSRLEEYTGIRVNKLLRTGPIDTATLGETAGRVHQSNIDYLIYEFLAAVRGNDKDSVLGKVLGPAIGDVFAPNVENLPLCLFGSPPTGWTSLKMVAAHASVGFVGLGATADHHPVLVAAYSGALAVIWMVMPALDEVRLGLAQKVKDAMHVGRPEESK